MRSQEDRPPVLGAKRNLRGTYHCWAACGGGGGGAGRRGNERAQMCTSIFIDLLVFDHLGTYLIAGQDYYYYF